MITIEIVMQHQSQDPILIIPRLPPSYTGSNCQYRINECDSEPCENGATCHDEVKYFTCHCPYGYTGKRCEAFVDWCANTPCMNGARCEQKENMYQCVCEPGWTGKVCDVEMVSCSDAAIRKSKLNCDIKRYFFFMVL